MTGKGHVELLQGTLDLIVLRALATMGPQHAYALAARLEQVADHPLLLNQGTLYPDDRKHEGPPDVDGRPLCNARRSTEGP